MRLGKKIIILGLILFLMPVFSPFCQEEKHVNRAVTEALSSNVLLWGFNRFVTNQEYARISPESMWENLSGEWVWDQDEYTVNQIGHPYQGSLYFTAGRANNLDFWESSALTAGGSIIWEYLMETETPSKNDLIITVMGGASVGEMLHRLYEKSFWSKSLWLSFFISPMDAVNYVITDKKPDNTEHIPLETETLLYFGSTSADTGNLQHTIGTGINIVYGKPFGLESKVPFEHFELNLDASFSGDAYYWISFFSDGLIRSWAPCEDLNSATTLGIGLHYDFIYSKDINYSANSLGFTLKRRNFLEHDFIFDIRMHLNWLVLGCSEYPYFINGDIPRPAHLDERRDYDMGTGENIKLSLELSHDKFGTLSLFGNASGIHTIGNAVPEEGSDGFIFVGTAGFSYERKFKSKYRVGLRDNFYYKLGIYDSAKDSDHYLNTFGVYIKVRT